MTVSQKSLDMIIGFEVTSQKYYEKSLIHPTFPKGDSGCTIGIGYDIGYNTKSQVQSDWEGKILQPEIDRLKTVAGIKGQNAKEVLPTIIDISIPFKEAKEVFIEKSMVRFAKMTSMAYKGVEELEPDAQGALLSLVYNRGSSTYYEPSDSSDSGRRKEMHNIIPLVAAKDYTGIAGEIRAMKRLWGSNMQGLLNRRDDEAGMVENSVREYTEEEKINL